MIEEASTLEEVMASIERQLDADELRRSMENPAPWFNLLHRPSRAAWRSTDHILGVADGGDNGADGPSVLSESGFNLIQHSERTNKQLKRTYRRVMEAHKSLATRRERERRLAANISNQKRQAEDGPEGSVKDDQGRKVGDWRDKNAPAAAPRTELSDDPSVAMAFSMAISSNANLLSSPRAAKLAKTNEVPSPSEGSSEKAVGYGPEYTLTNIRYRMGPNYSIVRRVLQETQSLLGGRPPRGSEKRAFRPRRVLDFGCGVGSSSAAALEVFGVSRSNEASSISNNVTNGSIDWIHSVDASQSMREATEKLLKSVLEGAPWDSEGVDGAREDEELEEFERMLRQIRVGSAATEAKRLERRQKRMQRWERTWTKRSDHRTRLTFGESIVDASSLHTSNKNSNVNGADRPPLPWQAKLDEQRRKASQKKSLTSQAKTASQTSQKGTFDLILCNYTLSEFPNVPSTLAASVLLWEKLAPNGVMVFVEPGTPDGFGLLRSIRSALLECCPPREIREKRRKARVARAADVVLSSMHGDKEDGGMSEEMELEGEDDDAWPEECRVIAPCTHNGTCPMSRHRHNHIKRNKRFGKYEATAEPQKEDSKTAGGIEKDSKHNQDGEEEDEENKEEGEEEEGGYVSSWGKMDEDEREELKAMLGVEGVSDEDMEEMLKMADEEDEDEEADEAEEEEAEYDDDGDDVDHDEHRDDNAFYNISKKKNESSKSANAAQTDVFDTSFCSFVQNFPGDTKKKRGEKFSYLVLQKRIVDDYSAASADQDLEFLEEADVTDMLSKSVYHAHRLKEDDALRRRAQKHFDNKGGKVAISDATHDTHHHDRLQEVLEKAVEVENEFLDSTIDPLGLELLIGDDRRKGWGRLVRAPLKRKGHVLLDYCSAGCKNDACSNNDTPRSDDHLNFHKDAGPNSDGTKGCITRHKVSRGWSARAAPGSYAAARKARWGGLWPDLSEGVKRAEHEDFARKKTSKKRM